MAAPEMFRKREFELEKFQSTKFENMFDNIEEIPNPNITERHTSKDSGIEYDEKVYPAKPNLGKFIKGFILDGQKG